jgi:hemolysin activation/secretion protein
MAARFSGETTMKPHEVRQAMKAVCAAALLLGAPVQAQVRPDAGSLQRDLEQRPLEAPRPSPALPGAPVRPALKADETQRFTVSALKIAGNNAFSSETLLALVRDELVGKTVTLAELQAAAAKITAFYRSRGYLVARAYIPAQRIAASGAEVEIAVIEGVLGEVKVENRSRLSEATAARFAQPLAPGLPLTTDNLERPILLLSDQTAVNPVLRPGTAVGSSDLALELGPSPLFAGQVGIDNWGNRFTGSYRLSAQLDLLSALGQGETLGAQLTETFDGLSSIALRGALPLGGNGWRVGASYSATRYELGEDFALLEASGTARAAGAFTSYPLVRSQRWNLNATLAAEGKDLEDRVDLTSTVTPRRTRAVSASASGDVRDPLAADSVLVWSATALSGNLSIDAPLVRAVDEATVMTQGDYRKYNVSLLYLQSFARNWTVYAGLQAQGSSKNLDSSEKFSLGGAQGVRAYPLGEAAGDQGALGTLELRYALPGWGGATPSVVLFADYGEVRINKKPFFPGRNERALGAAGIGLTLAKAGGFSLRAYLAGKTTDEAATSDTDRSSRAWLQAAKYF